MFDRTTIRNTLFLFVILYASPLSAQTAVSVPVNKLGSAGAGIAITTGASVEILPGSTTRYEYCVKCTVPVNCTWTDPTATDLGPAVTPTATVGYPIVANTDYCEDLQLDVQRLKQRAPADSRAIAAVRMDCISTSGSGTCYTREEQ